MPSVVTSLDICKVNEPEFAVIVTDPPAVTALAGSEKSALFMVPDTASMVQYKLVPLATNVVAMVYVIVLPSTTVEVAGAVKA